MPDLLFCAKYPFTKEAKDYVRESGAQISDEIIARAKKRALSALLEGEIPKFSEILPENFPREIFSYAAARMIVSQTKGRYFINRYAVAEAKRAGKYLSTEEDMNFSKALLEFGIPFSQEGKDRFKIPVLKYLKYSPKSIDYKLVNREVKEGFVFCTKQQLARIAEEAVKKSIETSLPIKAKVPPQVIGSANEIIKQLPVQEAQVSKIASEDFPPCIRDLLERLAVSENLPHTARWALAVYLVNAGMSVEAAANIFKTAPDYSRETTLYQITHVKERGYKMPSCSTMDTYGICNARCGCFSPLRYRRGMELRRKEGKGEREREGE